MMWLSALRSLKHLVAEGPINEKLIGVSQAEMVTSSRHQNQQNDGSDRENHL